MLSLERFQSAIAQYSVQLVDVVHDSQFHSPVPSCPGWTMADLLQHVSGTQRWSTEIVRTGIRGEHPVGPSDRAGLEHWFVDGAEQLVEVLKDTDPEAEVWNFGPQPRLASFWSRRQAHEVAVHLWDAMAAQDRAFAIDADLAVDGLDEVCTVFLYQKLRHGSLPEWAPILHLEPTDVVAAPSTYKQPDRSSQSAPHVTLRGPADQLLLAMWGRVGIEGLECEGDRELAGAFLASGVTP